MPLNYLRVLPLKAWIVFGILLPWTLVAQDVPVPATKPEAAPGTTSDHPVRISSGVMSAQAIKHPQPTSPTGVPAGVVLRVIIDPEGKVLRSSAMSGPSELRNAASLAVERWTYKPYLLNGAPVFVETSVTVVFRR